jgi:Zn-dependent protease
MHDPFAWSFPLGRLFGITIRIHWLFPFIALGFILHAAFGKENGQRFPPGLWVDATILMFILFFSVLLHEFGHCFAARAVNGDAQEVLLWPLGGLANVDVPHRPRAHFLVAAGGPAVNAALAVGSAVLLLFVHQSALQPIWGPLPEYCPWRFLDSNGSPLVALRTWSGMEVTVSPYSTAAWVARIFWVNYFLFLLNVVLVGFPLDGGRMLQSALWPSLGYRQATLAAVFAGFGVVCVVGLYALITREIMALCLALFIAFACQRQWVVLETGGEEGLFGYDFSQGYTSLERDQPAAPPVRRVSWWRAWLQRRAERKRLREEAERVAEEGRLDELLDKVHRLGQASLTDEERRFMKRVSDRYKNRR